MGVAKIVLPDARATFWRQFVCLDSGVRKWCFFARGVRDLGPQSGRIISVSDTHVPEHEVN